MTERHTKYFLIFLLIISLLYGGGYFVFISCITTIIMTLYLLFLVLRAKQVRIAWDINLLAILILIAAYLLTSIWAVDSGMAVEGFFKFLPVFLFFLLLCQIGDKKEQIISTMPLIGCLMTIFSFIMMQFEAFENLVSVAGRLAGFFQYPNTYALFMLICIIITVYQIDLNKLDWLHVVYIAVGIFGIYMSGSRTVFVLMGAVIVVMSLWKREVRRVVLPIMIVGAVIAVALLLLGNGDKVFLRFSTISLNSSTLLGRLLYDLDALQMLRNHTFGIGYYGYYFLQQEYQTGVYSVVNVHNEYLQMMLDVGILPAVLFFFSIIRSVCSKSNSIRSRLVLLVVLLHSLFDYDLQFLSMMLLILLFLEMKNYKEICISVFARVCAAALSLLAIISSISIGLSDVYCTMGRYQESIEFYQGNTMAKIGALQEAETSEEMVELADNILEKNQHISIAYSAKARAAFAEGDVEQFIKYKLKAIKLAPYQYEEYLDYLDTLSVSVVKYMKADDNDSAKVCLKRMEAVPDMLAELKERTNPLAWKIRDTPQVELPHEYLEMMADMRGNLYE